MTDKPEQTRLTDDIAIIKFHEAMTSAGWEPITDRFGSVVEWQCCTGKVVNHFTALMWWWVSGSTPGKMV